MRAQPLRITGAYRRRDDYVALIVNGEIIACPAAEAKAWADAIYAALATRDVGMALLAERA